ELLLLRHALPVSGHADPGLSDVGRAQAERVAQRLKGSRVDALVTSPLRRARETVAPIEASLGLTAEVIYDLREWELDDPNHVYDAVEDMAPDDPRLLAVAEGRYDDFVPELDTAAFQQRTVTAIEDAFARHQHQERIVVSTHGGSTPTTPASRGLFDFRAAGSSFDRSTRLVTSNVSLPSGKTELTATVPQR